MKLAIKIALAWFVGFVVYMLAAIVTGEMDGFPALLCQPVMAFGWSGLFVALALLVKLILRPMHLEKHKFRTRVINVALFIVGVVLLLFSQQLGLTDDQYNFPSGETVGPHPLALITGYFLTIFPFVN